MTHSARFMTLIALERLIRGLILLGGGIYLLFHTGTDVARIAYDAARALGLDPNRPWVRHTLAKLGHLREHEVEVFGGVAIAYGVLELVEGTGLLLRKRWAEWLTVVATSVLVPFELYELVRKPSALKAIGLAVNILIVLYLIRVVRNRET